MSIELAYLSGVYYGDGFCSDQSVGLCAKDKDFVLAFANTFNKFFGTKIGTRYEKIYLVFRTSNKKGKYNAVREFLPQSIQEQAKWVQGLFDSDGNSNCTKIRKYENSYYRRISFYKTDVETLFMLKTFLDNMGIKWKERVVKPSSSHLGTKIVYEVKLASSLQNFILFRDLINSNIERKSVVIDQIISTYCKDRKTTYQKAQQKGVIQRRLNKENKMPD